MIVNKTNKGFQTRSDMPNFNWLGDEWHIVPDHSELANKIMQLYPRYDFVLNDNGELVDVIEIAKTEVELIQEQINEIDRELKTIDSQGVTRHLENIIDANGTYDKLYETTKALIDKKNELRIQRADLLKKLL